MKSLTISQTFTDRSDEILKAFFRDISKIPILSVNEEVELALKAKKGDRKAINRLVECNLRFIVSVAKQYQGKGLPLMDLVQSGVCGAIKAAELFDVTKGFKFISYAVWWIRQSIILSLSTESRTVRIPTNQISNSSKINKVIDRFEQEYNRIPSIEEISEKSNLTPEKITNAITSVTKQLSLDVPFKDDEVGSLYDVIPNSNAESVDGNIIDQSIHNELNECIKELPDRESDIVRMYFGIDVEPMTYEEIGSRFGIGEERVRQLNHQALSKLRKYHGDRLKEIYSR